MSPIVKKALVAVGAMKAIEKINEKRNPPPPRKSRWGKLFVIGAALGALGYAYNSGKLQPVIDKVRGAKPGGAASSNGSGGRSGVSLGSNERSLSSPVA